MVKCSFCGKKFNNNFPREGTSSYCDEKCREGQMLQFVKMAKDKQRHEEIKQRAWELYQTQFSLADGIDDKLKRLRICWLTAEMFYNFAKEKEREEANDSN